MAAQAVDSKLFPEAIEAIFEEFVASTDSTMKLITKILQKAGLDTNEAALQPIRQFITSEALAKRGGSRALFRYDLSVFGLDETTLHKRFAS